MLHGLIQMNQSLEDTYEQHCIAMYERTIAWLFSRGRNFCNSFLHAKVRILSRIPSILGDISLSPSVMNACCLAMPCNFATIFIFLLLRIQLLISDTRLTELLDRVLSVSWNSWSMKFRTSIVDDNHETITIFLYKIEEEFDIVFKIGRRKNFPCRQWSILMHL